MLRIYPGYQSADGREPVARSAQSHREAAAPVYQPLHISRRRRWRALSGLPARRAL